MLWSFPGDGLQKQSPVALCSPQLQVIRQWLCVLFIILSWWLGWICREGPWATLQRQPPSEEFWVPGCCCPSPVLGQQPPLFQLKQHRSSLVEAWEAPVEQKFERCFGERQSLSGDKGEGCWPQPTPKRKVRVKQLCSPSLLGSSMRKQYQSLLRQQP